MKYLLYILLLTNIVNLKRLKGGENETWHFQLKGSIKIYEYDLMYVMNKEINSIGAVPIFLTVSNNNISMYLIGVNDPVQYSGIFNIDSSEALKYPSLTVELYHTNTFLTTFFVNNAAKGKSYFIRIDYIDKKRRKDYVLTKPDLKLINRFMDEFLKNKDLQITNFDEQTKALVITRIAKARNSKLTILMNELRSVEHGHIVFSHPQANDNPIYQKLKDLEEPYLNKALEIVPIFHMTNLGDGFLKRLEILISRINALSNDFIKDQLEVFPEVKKSIFAEYEIAIENLFSKSKGEVQYREFELIINLFIDSIIEKINGHIDTERNFNYLGYVKLPGYFLENELLEYYEENTTYLKYYISDFASHVIMQQLNFLSYTPDLIISCERKLQFFNEVNEFYESGVVGAKPNQVQKFFNGIKNKVNNVMDSFKKKPSKSTEPLAIYIQTLIFDFETMAIPRFLDFSCEKNHVLKDELMMFNLQPRKKDVVDYVKKCTPMLNLNKVAMLSKESQTNPDYVSEDTVEDVVKPYNAGIVNDVTPTIKLISPGYRFDKFGGDKSSLNVIPNNADH
jgi:hypothetical protein